MLHRTMARLTHPRNRRCRRATSPSSACRRCRGPVADLCWQVRQVLGYAAMKRFYAAVDTAPEAVGHVVCLDARPVRTPARNALAIPSLALAEAVAEEWRRQGEEIAPDMMPLTRLATTVLDLMPARREDAVDEAAGFAGTDLLCYRAAAPQVLVARQRAAWQPWLDW